MDPTTRDPNVLSSVVERITDTDGTLCIEEEGSKEQLEAVRTAIMDRWGERFEITISPPNKDGKSKLSMRHREPTPKDISNSPTAL